MPAYAYFCPNCGPFESAIPADRIDCRCGASSRRNYRTVGIIKSSLKHQGRWDPQVGAYVANDAEFRSLLAQGAARESESLGMDVKLATVDSRDSEGLAELHGWSVADREADLEGTRKRDFERSDK